MKRLQLSWIPAFAGMTLLTCLSACGCMPEEGDSMKVKDYWHGCWAEAKGNDR